MYKVIAFCGDSKLTLGIYHLVEKAIGVACSLFMSCSECNFGVLSDDGMPIATLNHSAFGSALLADNKPRTFFSDLENNVGKDPIL